MKEQGCDNKTAERSTNMFALGMLYYIFNRDLKSSFHYFQKRGSRKIPELIDINKIALQAGYNYANTPEALESVIQVSPAKIGERPLPEHYR